MASSKSRRHTYCTVGMAHTPDRSSSRGSLHVPRNCPPYFETLQKSMAVLLTAPIVPQIRGILEQGRINTH